MIYRILITLSSILCAIAFLLIARLGAIQNTPLAFWSGDQQKLQKQVKDIPGYNRKMAAAFRWYAGAFLVCAAAGSLFPLLGLIGLVAVCTLGLFLLYTTYRRILGRYS